MEKVEMDEVLTVLDSCISRIKWRLRPSAKRRLQTDILALCTGLRPVVMVDYGGKLPELQDQLCSLIHLCHKDTSILQPLRVMIIEEMIYLIHVKGLADYALSSLSFQPQLLFVDLEQDPPKMLLQTEESSVASQLTSIQKFFSSVFSAYDTEGDHLLDMPCLKKAEEAESSDFAGGLSHVDELITSQSSEFIDLSTCMQNTQITLPTLNGWLLGYPVVYLFSKDRIADAVYNLSTKPLNLFMIFVGRNTTPGKGLPQEELMSFSVPYDLSMSGANEPWAKTFLTQMQAKFELCKQSWRYLRMEVSECYPQSIAL